MKVEDLIKDQQAKKPYYPKILIYGPFRSGKTAFVGQMGARGHLMDFDRGLGTLASMDDKYKSQRFQTDVECFFEGEPYSPTEFQRAKSHVLKLASLYRQKPETRPVVIGVDSLTGLAKAVQYYILRNSGHAGNTPTQPEWGLILNEIENFVNLVRGLPAIVVMTAHEYVQTLPDDSAKVKILCPGVKLPTMIAGFFDDVFYCRLKKLPGSQGGGCKYTLSATPTSVVECGTRTSFKGDYDMDLGFWPFLQKLGYLTETQLQEMTTQATEVRNLSLS
jgi:hypothetical protein